MKPNLSDFPEFVSEKYGKLIQEKGKSEAFRLYSLEVELWKSAFEKQLQKRLKEFSEFNDGLPLNQDAFNSGVCQILKEILGE